VRLRERHHGEITSGKGSIQSLVSLERVRTSSSTFHIINRIKVRRPSAQQRDRRQRACA
jgi:hypothetical protein